MAECIARDGILTPNRPSKASGPPQSSGRRGRKGAQEGEFVYESERRKEEEEVAQEALGRSGRSEGEENGIAVSVDIYTPYFWLEFLSVAFFGYT